MIMDAPESFAPEMQAMSQVTNIITEPEKTVGSGFIMAFVTRQEAVNKWASILAPKLEGDGVLWFCYPKGSSKKYACDFNRDSGWDALAKQDFEPVRMVAIDADWSALRFRKVQFIKTMSRSFALTEAGKNKAGKNSKG